MNLFISKEQFKSRVDCTGGFTGELLADDFAGEVLEVSVSRMERIGINPIVKVEVCHGLVDDGINFLEVISDFLAVIIYVFSHGITFRFGQLWVHLLTLFS